MQTINTNNGDYSFEPQKFTLGIKVIDMVISKENLLLFQKIMKNNNIFFSLAYGTLLGAIRENNFIEHDEDIDVAIIKEDEDDFLDTLFELQENGFIVGRYEQSLLSVIRKDEYIDIYIFEKTLFGNRKFGNEILKEKYLFNTIEYDFLSSHFNIPKDYIEYLEVHYGENWKVPLKNTHACNPSLYLKTKQYIQKRIPLLFKFLSWFKAKVK